MKKITIQFSVIAGLIGLMFLLPYMASAQADQGTIKLSRTFYPAFITPGSNVTVTIFLDKGYMGGLARLDEFVPSGFTISEGDKNGSTFYVSDTVAHFAWQSMPSEPGFTVSYHLRVPANALGNYGLIAQFSYRTSTGATTKYFKPFVFTVRLPSDTIAVAAQPAVVPASQKAAVIPAKPVAAKAPVVSKPAVKIAKTVYPRQTSIIPPPAPAPTADEKSNGLYYRVQIMASAQRLDVDSVIINGIRDKLCIITKNGISRYYIGAFHDLQPAVEYRDRILNNGLKGPFVVAYKDGNKITIKESLSIVRTN